ncbi:(d)CMP kinase [Oerskovia turbata]|uniref:Cytidylate kinase n=1 Tax=Oerskovia turbata TaxID=1713 RepID=A0A4Q1KRK9_9CELL|nr:(d)CMP kinase [Oerskovia turbata]RXR22082.1 (d)CMP kinase [Oerskovia turbata]RXR31959.1 (d)CMP kinase [Oerskovia turbata]TGJ96923.1 (d)CMP kinase [Actinotalea fermentans ATCC 43279 = JCM 9966 = DSM 3133]
MSADGTGAGTPAARGLVVAIDGPSGSGKSSVSRAVAQRLGTAYLDTGAMYRAATWWCLEENVDLADHNAVAAAVDVMPLVMGIDPAAPTVHVDGTDVGEAIRTTEISTAVSAVATNLAVRAELRRLQRVIIAAESSASSESADASFSGGRGIVAEGRDITTVVAPDADVRILLTASEEARLARRSLEVHGAADAAAVEATKDQVLRRDRDDATVSQFHVAADGVVTVDSSDLDFEQTIQAVLDVVEQVMATAATTPDAVTEGEGTAR